MEQIYLRNQPPPIETFDHTAFISFLADWIRPESYLELGVRGGENFRAISSRSVRSTAVDMAPVDFEMPSNSRFFLGKTDEFFDQLDPSERFDLIFIDADHSYGQSLADFMNAQRFLVEDGFVIFHDTYPLNDDFIDPDWCGDCYRTPLYIKQNLSDSFETLTLPFHPGVSIVKKISNKKQMVWKES